MSFNRDIAVLVLKVFQERAGHNLKVCDPFAGCGVRGIRFLKEVANVEHVVLNDRNLHAVSLITLNAKGNRLSENVTITNMDANVLLGHHTNPKRKFDIIDIDPFGSPTTFLDSAVRATKNNGLIALTATDMAPLCGNKSLACLRKYLGRPLRTEYCHELAVRLLINALVLTSVKHNVGIKVLFSHSTNHYIRIYAQVSSGAKKANESLGKLGYVAHCFNCLNRKYSRGYSKYPEKTCEFCNSEMAIAGPLWIAPLYEKDFCEEMRKEATIVDSIDKKRAIHFLNIILMEVCGPPTYFVVDKITEKIGLPGLSKAKLIKKLVEHGYKTTETHFNQRGIRSEASINIIKDVASNLLGN